MRNLSSLESAVQQVSENLSPKDRAEYFFRYTLENSNLAEFGIISEMEKERRMQNETKSLLNMDKKHINKFGNELSNQVICYLTHSLMDERIRHINDLIRCSNISLDFIRLLESTSPDAAGFIKNNCTELIQNLEILTAERDDILNSDMWNYIEKKVGYQRPDYGI